MHHVKKAFITGITGQDGSYLAELLLEKGYDVHGLVRRVAIEDPSQRLWRIKHLLPRITLHPGSLETFPSLYNVFNRIRPDECYHLAAQSYVGHSFDDEFSTFQTNISGTHYILAALKECAPECRFYFASSSEMFGRVRESPQDENTPFHPHSAYGISKVAGFHLARNYRETYGVHASCGILYNHESPRRGMEYVTRKISSGAARIKLGQATELKLGNLDARRDWGHAKEYVDAIWRMVQEDRANDYVVATGESHSVREFVEAAFGHLQLDYRDYVKVDPLLVRPADPYMLVGRADKAREKLGWSAKIRFNDLVREMVDADLNLSVGPTGRLPVEFA